MNGLGRANYNNMLYEGYFKNNQLDGYGRQIMKDGTHYTGFFKNDRKHGRGTMVRIERDKESENYGDICVEEGEWFNDVLKEETAQFRYISRKEKEVSNFSMQITPERRTFE